MNYLKKTQFIFCFLFLFYASMNESTFACSEILLVSNNTHFAIVHRIESVLYAHPAEKPKLSHAILENIDGQQLFKKIDSACLVVSIGTEAVHYLLRNEIKKPIISILIRKNFIRSELEQYGRQGDLNNGLWTAIYLDQPIERQLKLIKTIFKQSENSLFKIGVLLGSSSLEDEVILERLARNYHLNLNSIFVNKLENPVAVLDALLNDAQVVLAIPDNQIYNPKTSRGILLTAFHKRVPLIAYSKTYVNNGALCAVYSTTKQIADQSAQLILKSLHHSPIHLPYPQYPKEFAIAVNYQVAQSLNLKIDNESQLMRTLTHMEKKHG